MTRVLAVDVGATEIRGVLADESGLREAPWVFPTAVVADGADATERGEALAERIRQELSAPIDAVGVAAAGVFDRDARELVETANWAGAALGPLETGLGVPLGFENDADASVRAIQRYGRGDGDGADNAGIDGRENLAYLCIGTGIGVGVVHEGRLIRGVEAGFANVNWDGDVTHFGVTNPWEGYASGARLADRVREWVEADDRETALTGREDAEAFFEAVYDGDPVAHDYYTRLKRINAAGIGTVANVFSLDTVVVDGGVAGNHPRLVDYEDDPYATEEISLDDYCVSTPPIVERRADLASFDDELELYGAAASALAALE
jgi:glucokinase